MSPPELLTEIWSAILRSLVSVPTLPEAPASVVVTQPVAVCAFVATVFLCPDDRVVHPGEAFPPPLKGPAVDSDKGTRLVLGKSQAKLLAQHLNRRLVQFVGLHAHILAPKVPDSTRSQKELWVCLGGNRSPCWLGKMKKFTCRYMNERGGWDRHAPLTKVEATNVEEAARIFAKRYPSENPKIEIASTWGATEVVYNPVIREREQQQQAKERERRAKDAINRQKDREQQRRTKEERRAKEEKRAKEAEEQQRLESLQKLHSSVESADGNLAGLTYIELSALVENLKEFPSVRDKISPEECAVREELYKMAFFDRKLQAGLQTEQAELQTKQAELQTKQAELQTEQAELQTSLLNQIASGQPTAGAAGPGKSNLARNAAMVGGLAALQKLTQIEENTGDVSEGFGFD